MLTWFASHARDLPWRRRCDAYAIWVSEVMLQQTQVATVVPYFERFLQRFPDLQSLARAEEHDVLRLWEGLGYYRRARALHRAARIMECEHGEVPADPAVLRRLPGFGRYTVNAVLSQAFDARLPIVEANSRRVLSRLLGVRPSSGAEELWQAATSLLPRRRAGAFNQALMEVGALICTPEEPACNRCPLHAHCYARQHHLQTELPGPNRRPAAIVVAEVALVIRHGDRLLLVQRPAGGRWGSLWEFPHVARELLEAPQATARRLLATLGLDASLRGEIATIRHSVTHHRITMIGLALDFEHGDFIPGRYVQGRWLTLAELEAYPLSAPQRRLALLAAEKAKEY